MKKRNKDHFKVIGNLVSERLKHQRRELGKSRHEGYQYALPFREKEIEIGTKEEMFAGIEGPEEAINRNKKVRIKDDRPLTPREISESQIVELFERPVKEYVVSEVSRHPLLNDLSYFASKDFLKKYKLWTEGYRGVVPNVVALSNGVNVLRDIQKNKPFEFFDPVASLLYSLPNQHIPLFVAGIGMAKFPRGIERVELFGFPEGMDFDDIKKRDEFRNLEDFFVYHSTMGLQKGIPIFDQNIPFKRSMEVIPKLNTPKVFDYFIKGYNERHEFHYKSGGGKRKLDPTAIPPLKRDTSEYISNWKTWTRGYARDFTNFMRMLQMNETEKQSFDVF